MDMKNLLVCILMFATASAEVLLPDPKLVRIKKLKTAINTFSFNLLKELLFTEGEANVFICPYSLANSLGLLHFISVNETEKELADVLGYTAVNLTKGQAANTFYVFPTELQSSKPKLYTFKSLSTILLNRKYLLLTFEGNADLFHINAFNVDFMELGEPLVRAVNDWMATLTENTILNALNFIDPSSHMIVVSVAYFKGLWRHKFPLAGSKLDLFYNLGSEYEAKEVHMMRMNKVLLMNTYHDLSIVELPFKGRNVSMIILLPRQLDGLEELIERFSPDFLHDKMQWMVKTHTHIVLPKFSIEFGEVLTGSLQSLGVKKLFHPLDRVIHKAKVSVAENGVEATAQGIEKVQPRTSKFDESSLHLMKHFVVDHPFMFVIYERRIDMVLFLGFVMEL